MEWIQEFGGSLLHQYQKGGFAMHPIALLSVISLALIIYKAIVFRRARSNVSELTVRVRRELLKGRVGHAVEACEEFQGPEATVLKAGLLQYDAPRDEIERHMEAATVSVLAKLQRYLGGLATIANIAPLIGFFGTVVGMILSFEELAVNGMGNPGAVAKGIAVALLTTAFGLMVAVMTQPFYNLYLSKVSGHADQIEIAAHACLDAIGKVRRAKPE